MYDLQCLTCADTDSDENCRLTGTYQTCEQGYICKKSTTPGGMVSRNCADPDSDCPTGNQEVCYGDGSCMQCSYFEDDDEDDLYPWSRCVPPYPCEDEVTGEMEALQCRSCQGASSDDACRDDGPYVTCSDNEICYRGNSSLEDGSQVITRGCMPLDDCNMAALSGTPGYCLDDVCLQCGYFLEQPEPPIPWSRCGVPEETTTPTTTPDRKSVV